MKTDTTVRMLEATIEESETVVVTAGLRALTAYCTLCARNVRMLRVEDAGRITGASVRFLYRAVEAGETHFVESPGGDVYVCLNDILRRNL